MCGFVAIYNANDFLFQPEILISMTNELIHRGPDDYCYAFAGPKNHFMWRDNIPAPVMSSGIAMGHRRLSILDLSSAGRQPFVSKDKRFWMVYNGEVFNYRELREELRRAGHSFVTKTDTEVVLIAYQEWGKDFLNRLNGMWALIIWDNKTRTLLASRDRFGIKPLFYYRMKDLWIFASEIKALLKYPGFHAQPKKDAIFRFLWAEQHPEAEQTYFKDILSLPAASYLLINEDKSYCDRFWYLPDYTPLKKAKPEDTSKHFFELFRDSVRLRLRSDVRVGTMLSGGLDSTSIVKTINDLLNEQVEETSSVHGIQQAVSACYPNLWNDETHRINDLVSILRINVEKVYPAQEDIHGRFYDVINAMDEPFIQSSPLVQHLLMHRARSLGIKVTLNGHGPDEMLAGYPLRHCAIVTAEHFTHFRIKKWFDEMTGMKKWHNLGPIEFSYDLLFNMWPIAGAWVRNLFRLPKKKYFYKKLFNLYPIKPYRLFDLDTGGRTALDRRLRREFFVEVLPPILTYEDRMSMSASVESRVPFLDYRLVEFAFSLNDSDKIYKGITKYIIRNAMNNVLPSSIVNEKIKLYFNGPIDIWLRGSLKPIVNTILMEGDPFISEFMNPKQFRPLIMRVLDPNYFDDWDEMLVWRMLIAEAWMRFFFG